MERKKSKFDSLVPRSIARTGGSTVTNRASRVSSGIFVHQDYVLFGFRTKLSAFGDDFPPKSLTHSNDAELELPAPRWAVSLMPAEWPRSRKCF
jgi:hypothetical protein